jgi:hypothetical protein
MLTVIMIGVIATSGLLYALDVFEDDDDQGEDLMLDGSDDVIGTDGDDTLVAETSASGFPEFIRLGEGDDFAIVGSNQDPDNVVSVIGQAGDDTIAGVDTFMRVIGGGGDDVLIGDISNRVGGGAGDDTLVVGATADETSLFSKIAGEDGDDTVIISTVLGEFNDLLNTNEQSVLSPNARVTATGGEGADDFLLEFSRLFEDGSVGGENATLERSIFHIADFDPTEDEISVGLFKDPTNIFVDGFFSTEFELSSLTMTQTETDDGFLSKLRFEFFEGDAGFEGTVFGTVLSDRAFGLSEIDILTDAEVARIVEQNENLFALA